MSKRIIIKTLLVAMITMLGIMPAMLKAEAANPWETPPVPTGWTHVTGTWNTGYVIKDINGNEFVWVPVGAITGGGLQAYDWGKGITTGQVTYETIPAQITNAITDTGGFYVARYEASSNGGKAQSKQGIAVLNNINWFDSKSKSESMASDYGWTDISSHLMYDKEWDVIVKWFEQSGKSVTDSISYGNHRDDPYTGDNGLMNTGSRSEYMVKNIYDMAGNIWEWTMDSCFSSRLIRGGYCCNDGSYYPVSCRNNSDPSGTHIYYGFRPAFVVLNSTPSVALSTPEDGASYHKGETVTFSWTAVDNDPGDAVAAVDFKIGFTPGGSDTLNLQNQPASFLSYDYDSSTLVGEMPKTLYWAVRAKDTKGIWSDWVTRTIIITNSGAVNVSIPEHINRDLSQGAQGGQNVNIPASGQKEFTTGQVGDQNLDVPEPGQKHLTVGEAGKQNLNVPPPGNRVLETGKSGSLNITVNAGGGKNLNQGQPGRLTKQV